MKRGRVIHSPLFVVRMIGMEGGADKDSAGASTRLAAVAPVKVAKTSVLRHRIRRRIYEAARPHMQSLVPGHAIIFFAKQAAITADLPAIRAAVAHVFVKAGLLR